MQEIMQTLQLPPRENLSSLVNFESLRIEKLNFDRKRNNRLKKNNEPVWNVIRFVTAKSIYTIAQRQERPVDVCTFK
jgi:hypothetical protein